LLLKPRQLQKNSQNNESEKADYEKRKADILELLNKETQLRSKRDIISKFIDIRLPTIQPEDNLIKVFNEFWNQEKIEAIKQICKDEDLNEEKFHQIISEYNFTGKEPLRETVFSACNQKLKLKERKEVYPRIIDKLRNLVTKFDDNLGDIEEKEEVNVD
jgi:type I restriction enzyme R subunit